MKVFVIPRSYGKTNPRLFDMLKDAGLEVARNETGGILDKETMKTLLADCDGIIVGVDPLDAEVLAAAPNLKAIAKYGVGMDKNGNPLRPSIDIDEILVIGGGAKGPVWRQMMVDIYNAKITVPVQLEEAASMGAAVTGGVGAGIFKDFTAIDQMLEINAVVEPNPAAHAAYAPVKEAFEVCYEAMLPVYKYMAERKVIK